MPSLARSPRSLTRAAAIVAVIGLGAVGLIACQNARVGAHCTSGFAQQGNDVLICRSGRWSRWATKSAVAQALAAHMKRNQTPPASGTPSSTGFSPAGTALPDDATCAAAVTPAAEIRAGNATPNATPGSNQNLTQPYPLFSRVDGAYTGTTDQIIQWAACKWGFDPDVLRAQVAVESWWDQNAVSGWQTDPTQCVPGHPIGADGHAGQCPEFSGLLSIRYSLFQNAYPLAMSSTAYDLDYALAYWRACDEGQMTWLNTVDRGSQYAAGDAWGCIGVWGSGRWHTTGANSYIALVQNDLSQRIWTTPSFVGS